MIGDFRYLGRLRKKHIVYFVSFALTLFWMYLCFGNLIELAINLERLGKFNFKTIGIIALFIATYFGQVWVIKKIFKLITRR